MVRKGQARDAGKTSTRNVELAAALEEAGCTYETLATHVNRLARHQGQVTKYDKGTVSRWISGTPPRADVVWVIAEALSELLGRAIQPQDLNFTTADECAPVVIRSLLYRENLSETLHTLAELSSEDVNRRTLLGAVPFISNALLAPQRSWLLWAWEQAEAEAPDLAVMSPSERVGKVYTMISMFDQMDNAYGGEGVRTSILTFLNLEVLPLLRRGVRSSERIPLFTAAAKLGAMAGWSSYDCGEYGLAQRYMTQALRLCQEGGDLVLAGQILAGLSHLATNLGHPEDGVYLARAGLQTAKHAGSPLGLMRLYAMLARGYAAQQHADEAHRALGAAESVLAQSPGVDQESAWVRYLDHHYLEAEAACAYRDLGQAQRAEQMAAESVRANPDRRRRQAISQSVLATAYLQQNRLDEALASARTALTSLEAVRSQRSVQALRDFGLRLEARRKEPAVQHFLHLAKPVLRHAS
ncbi:tetratricopeptide repeat protein [Streptomyces rimosus subsp. rimosus]|nr:hypothetical protein [Streptomyces peucetius]KOT52687.1 tetratricopeptide repeat protein [Streptomyces rimosus subsp. rimosus]